MNSFLYDVQTQVADLLNKNIENVVFLAEDSKTIDFEIKNNIGKQGIVGVVMTPKANFIGNYEDQQLAWEIEELTIEIVENPTVNRSKQHFTTGQTASMQAFDVLCHPKNGNNGKFSATSYEQGEDGGLLVNKSILKCVVWKASDPDYLCFTAEEDGSQISMKAVHPNNPYSVSLQFTSNGIDFEDFVVGETTITLDKGDKVYIVATNKNYGMASSYDNYNSFSITGKIAVSGSINSLLDRDFNSVKSLEGREYCFYGLFKGCTGLTKAPELPCTSLVQDCYERMFEGCTSLVEAPELPAEKLKSYCYNSMFKGCTSLKTPPALPATTIADRCYESMFERCTSITSACDLKSTDSPPACYANMFKGCTSLTKAPQMPEYNQGNRYLRDDMFYGMFEGCTSLVEAHVPKSGHIVVNRNVFARMYAGCTSLKTPPELPYTAVGEHCYDGMFEGCTSLSSAPELPATTLKEYCYFAMFRGCTSLKTPPALPATTLANNCYESMFERCIILGSAPELPAPLVVRGCYYAMFRGCTFFDSDITLPATNANVQKDCYAYFLTNCTYYKSTLTVSFPMWPYRWASDYDGYFTTDWLVGTGAGTFKCPSGVTHLKKPYGVPSNWTFTH